MTQASKRRASGTDGRAPIARTGRPWDPTGGIAFAPAKLHRLVCPELGRVRMLDSGLSAAGPVGAVVHSAGHVHRTVRDRLGFNHACVGTGRGRTADLAEAGIRRSRWARNRSRPVPRGRPPSGRRIRLDGRMLPLLFELVADPTMPDRGAVAELFTSFGESTDGSRWCPISWCSGSCGGCAPERAGWRVASAPCR